MDEQCFHIQPFPLFFQKKESVLHTGNFLAVVFAFLKELLDLPHVPYNVSRTWKEQRLSSKRAYVIRNARVSTSYSA